MKYSLRSLMTFSIRDLFWVTVVVAMGVAWLVDRWRTSAGEMEQYRLKTLILKNMLEDEGYTVYFDGTWPYGSVIVRGHGVEMEGLLYYSHNPYRRRELPTSSAPVPNPPNR